MIAPTSFFADYGCHVRILEEARALARLGQSVTIVTYRNGRDVPGLDIRRTLPIPWRRDYEVGSSRHKVAFDVLLAATSLKEALRSRPDVIHGHLHEGALIGSVVGRLLDRPMVFDFQGSLTGEMIDHGFLDPEGRFVGAMRKIEAAIDRAAATIVTSSVQATNHLEQEIGLDPEKVVLLPDCVDAETFRPDRVSEGERREWRLSLGIPAERKVVVYLGLLAPYQGTDLLLEAAAEVVAARSDVHFLIMGFPAIERYKADATARGIAEHVTFTGPVAYGDAPGYLSLGDVAVAPKMSSTEGNGKILNYMALALPTVAFDTPVNRGFMDSLGIYAELGSSHDLAAKLLTALCDPGAAERGARLRERAIEAFSWEHAGERLLEVYDAVAPSTTRAG